MFGRLRSWFRRSASPNSETFNLDDPGAWRSWLDRGAMSDAGQSVGKRQALTLAPVWQCVSMISGDCAKLPCKIYKRLPNGGRDIESTHPVARLLDPRKRVNEDITGHKLWRRWFASALLWQNGYIWIERRGPTPVALYNLPPDRTCPYKDKNGQLWYACEINGRVNLFHPDDVLHLEGLQIFDSWKYETCDLVEHARHDFGLALAARKFTSGFFKNGAHLGGILQVPPGTLQPAVQRVQQAVEQHHTSAAQAFRTMVLQDGFKWFSTSVEPQKAQLVELGEQEVRNVARWFNVRPSKLGVKESISYNSEEAAKQDYYDGTLSHWMIAAATEMNAKLLSLQEQKNDTHFIEHVINALLWADAKARSEIANTGIQSGRFTVDETRAWENMNPLPDGLGAKPYRPLNVTVAGDEPPKPAKDNPATDAPPKEPDADDETIRTHRKILANEIARVIRRVGVHAERAAAAPEKFNEWLGSFENDHREAAIGMLADVLEACRSVHKGRSIATADQLVSQVCTLVRDGLSQERSVTKESVAASITTLAKTSATLAALVLAA